MDERVAAKLARHAREGVSYPNRGSSVTPEIAAFEAKMAKHKATGKPQGETVAAEPAAEEKTTPVIPKPADVEHKATGKHR